MSVVSQKRASPPYIGLKQTGDRGEGGSRIIIKSRTCGTVARGVPPSMSITVTTLASYVRMLTLATTAIKRAKTRKKQRTLNIPNCIVRTHRAVRKETIQKTAPRPCKDSRPSIGLHPCWYVRYVYILAVNSAFPFRTLYKCKHTAQLSLVYKKAYNKIV